MVCDRCICPVSYKLHDGRELCYRHLPHTIITRQTLSKKRDMINKYCKWKDGLKVSS